MSYKNLDDLPDPVKNALPKHVQEMYLAAFNNAWSQYKEEEDRQGSASREEASRKIAWSAVVGMDPANQDQAPVPYGFGVIGGFDRPYHRDLGFCFCHLFQGSS